MNKIYKRVYTNGREDNRAYQRGGMKQSIRYNKKWFPNSDNGHKIRTYGLILLDEVDVEQWTGKDKNYLFSIDEYSIQLMIQAETFVEAREAFYTALEQIYPDKSFDASEVTFKELHIVNAKGNQ